MKESHYFLQARAYLLGFDGVTDEVIDRQLTEWQDRRPKNFQDLYKAYLVHAANRRNMPQTIGDIENLAPVLFDFDHNRVLDAYTSWESLFDTVNGRKLVPPGRMKKNNPRSYWVIFCKTILTSAEFLRSFSTLNDYEDYIDDYMSDVTRQMELADHIASKVHGMGFALACDLLKETGHPQYVKPDIHVCKISYELGISQSLDPRQVFQDVIAYARRIDRLPYEVDKLFWLVGSGNFYLSVLKRNSSRDEFIRFARQQNAGENKDLDSIFSQARMKGEASITWDGVEYVIRPA